MKIHEYQAKEILRRFDVPTPRGRLVTAPDEVREAARSLGGRVVLKAQIHAGGRGKGTIQDAATGEPLMRPGSGKPMGGVVVAADPDDAARVAGAMLGNVLVTVQTGPEGRRVQKVLVEEALDIVGEYYLAMLLDRARKTPVFVASREGGMEIEKVAAERPEAILQVDVNPRTGYSPWMGRRLAFGLAVERELVSPLVRLAGALSRAFQATDASLVEINPLVRTAEGRLLALDAKMTFDDNALFRHPDIQELRDLSEEDPLEVEASRYGLNYIKLDGNVGCMVNGAGLAMATMDIIKYHGGSPANFLDVGGGATVEMVTAAFRILLKDPNVRAVLINIFGGIMRCDVVAEGVVQAAKATGVALPVVVRLEGTNVEKGREILQQSGLTFQVAEGMRDAAEKVVAAAEGS